MFTTLVLGLFLSALLSTFGQVHAYIPASPTNDTSAAIQNGLNVSDVSKLHLQWYSTGSLSETVSYQLVGADSTGFTQGVLLHFTENMNTSDFTQTPWIALVSCDANTTNASQKDDIFTLARDAGAKSALLYSIYSQECIINPEYADPASFDQVLDIFSTQSLTTATLIEYQFGQFGWKNESYYADFNTTQLNRSIELVNETFATNNPTVPGFIFATLTAYNATEGQSNGTDTDGDGNSDNGSGGGGGGSNNTGLAMIILYAITGCVAALFCVVIISGAVRAIRHPERYGPRARHMGGMHGPVQSRARGLTRAIVDTFPIVKFGSHESQTSTTPVKDHETGTGTEPGSATGPRDSTVMKDWEMMDVPIEMIERGDDASRPIAAPSGPKKARPWTQAAEDQENYENDQEEQPEASGSTSPPHSPSQVVNGPRISAPRGEAGIKDVVPAAIGRETCPICIVDFEEGDDLRMLPCEGKHRFHQDCVDPWLLELSSSCPICRQDFQALEDMISGEGEDEDEMNNQPHIHAVTSSGSPAPNQGRFTRYLRFARRRRNHRDEQTQHEQASGDGEHTGVPHSEDNGV